MARNLARHVDAGAAARHPAGESKGYVPVAESTSLILLLFCNILTNLVLRLHFLQFVWISAT